MNCKAAGLIRCFQCAQIVLPSVLIVKLYVAASKCYGCAFMIFVVDFVMYHFFKISSAGFQTDFTGIFFPVPNLAWVNMRPSSVSYCP